MTRPRRPATRAIVATAVGLTGLSLTGCAERGLVAGPSSTPSTLTWGAVWTGAALAAVVVGVLLTLPAWQTRTGARLAVTVLSVQTGAVVVTGSVLLAVAARTWQLLDRPVDAEPATALLRLSRIDGDTAFLALIVLLVAVLTALGAGLTALATRFAAGTDVLERSIACALLALELGVSGFAVVRLLTGAQGWAYVAGAVAFPCLAIAFGACWPVAASDQAEPA